MKSIGKFLRLDQYKIEFVYPVNHLQKLNIYIKKKKRLHFH